MIERNNHSKSTKPSCIATQAYRKLMKRRLPPIPPLEKKKKRYEAISISYLCIFYNAEFHYSQREGWKVGIFEPRPFSRGISRRNFWEEIVRGSVFRSASTLSTPSPTRFD